MERRQFISSCAAGLALSALGVSTRGLAQSSAEQSWKQAFAAALQEKPWLAGYSSVSQASFQSRAQLSGRWPEELQGTLYRNGPARHEIGDFRYQHWFDGDGMLQSFKMTPAGVSHTGKMIQTRKYQAEQKAGRALYPGFASVPPNPAAVTSADLVNVGNISVLPHHGKLLALWEAGSPWEIDAETLETRGLYQFSSDTAGVPFSAHPRVESDGTLWNFGYVSAADLIVLWHLDPSGKIVKMGKIPSDPISLPHDFIVTSRHIVLLMPPLNYQSGRARSFLDTHQWQPEQATRVLVVDKNDFGNYHWLELPSQWVFHYGNGWEDQAGVIRFDGARGPDPLSMINSFRDIMRGEITQQSPSAHHQYRIDTRNWSISETPLFSANFQSEFPTIDPRVSCNRYRKLVMLYSDDGQPSQHGQLSGVCSYDLDSDKRVLFRYPDTQIPEEHLFVPKSGSRLESSGWVVGTALDWKQQRTLLNVFDAQAIDAGPIATATLPYALPLGLHGKFVAA